MYLLQIGLKSLANVLTFAMVKCIHMWSRNFHENAEMNVKNWAVAKPKQTFSNKVSFFIGNTRHGEIMKPAICVIWPNINIELIWNKIFHRVVEHTCKIQKLILILGVYTQQRLPVVGLSDM